jgi:hypothetical protein
MSETSIPLSATAKLALDTAASTIEAELGAKPSAEQLASFVLTMTTAEEISGLWISLALGRPLAQD